MEKKNEVDDFLGRLVSCDPKTLPCVHCIKAYYCHGSPFSISCGAYTIKPDSVYYESKECPKFDDIRKYPDNVDKAKK